MQAKLKNFQEMVIVAYFNAVYRKLQGETEENYG